MISAGEFERLNKARRARSFVDLMRTSPLCGAELKLKRERDYGRPIDL